ncbi:MAG: toll/interleukin-1 receptor domain-containing protein [Armatimonadetes bacterium]|nr:toll/interleukin-1 receptor domain-containing protein [Armatimonadota bacterium]
MAASYTQSSTPLRRRKYDVFLSHAHVDGAAVLNLKRWLEDPVGLQVWFDADKMAAGEKFPSALARGVADCRAMIVGVSTAALKSNWVDEEREQGLAQQGVFRQFPVIPVRLDPCELPIGLFSASAVDAFGGNMTGIEAARLLRGIHGIRDFTPPEAVRRQTIDHICRLAGDPPDGISSAHMPVMYVTCGWRDTDNEQLLRTTVCRLFSEEGFHLVGDAEDHPHTLDERIQGIMSGCSGQLVIIPKRGESFDHEEYKYVRAEMRLAAEIPLKQYVIAEAGTQLPPSMADSLVVDLARDEFGVAAMERRVRERAEDLYQICRPPEKPHYVFVATDYEDLAVKEHVVRHIAQVAGIPCLKGSDLEGRMPARKIELAIENAALTIANIVSATGPDDVPVVNWNTCIEAGIAMGARNRMHAIARRAETDKWKIKDHLPFMIRDNTVQTYRDDQHLIGLVHKYARSMRRRVIGM